MRLAVECGKSGRVSFNVKVQAGAKHTAVAGIWNQALKLRITKPAVNGAANEACIVFLAGLLGVGRRDIEIVAGEHSTRKKITVAGLTPAQVRERLEIE